MFFLGYKEEKMDIYLLEKENCPTWAVLANDEATASMLITAAPNPFTPKGAMGHPYSSELKLESYTARRFIEGKDLKYPLIFIQ